MTQLQGHVKKGTQIICEPCRQETNLIQASVYTTSNNLSETYAYFMNTFHTHTHTHTHIPHISIKYCQFNTNEHKLSRDITVTDMSHNLCAMVTFQVRHSRKTKVPLVCISELELHSPVYCFIAYSLHRHSCPVQYHSLRIFSKVLQMKFLVEG